MKRSLLFAALLGALSLPALAQQAASLDQQGNAAYRAGDYPRAIQLLVQAYESDRRQPGHLYNAACAAALAGEREQAFALLRRALAAGYANARGTAADNDFKSLREDTRWIPLLKDIEAAEQRAARLWDSPALATPYRENISEDEKVAGLSRFWSEVKFNFVDTEKLKDLDWDRLYLDYLPRVRASKSTAEYYLLLMELCARLTDGHTNVYAPKVVYDQRMASTLLRAALVEGRVIVTGVDDPALKESGIAPGAEVLTVDGEPVQAWSKREVAPYQSASTAQDLAMRIYGYSFLEGPAAHTPRVRFALADGRIVETPVKRVDSDTWQKSRRWPEAFAFRLLPGNIAYVQLNSFGNADAANAYFAAFDQIKQASALILDVRNNGGGNGSEGFRVLSTIARAPFLSGRWATRQYMPAFRAWRRPMPDLENAATSMPADAQRHFDGPVMVLTGPASYSAAEDFAAVFKTMQRGQIVGEATGGSTGQPLFFALPGGGRARVCTKRDTYADGSPWVGIGIQPDIAVAPTVADMRSGRDTVLEAALSALRKNLQ